MEKVAIYASFKNQSRNSIDFLLKRLSDYCLLKNYDYTIYFDKVNDRLSLNRKELNNLKEEIESGEYKKIVIKNITQLSRDTFSNIEFLQFLEDNDCEIESVDGTDLKLYKKIFEHFSKKKEEKIR